MELCGSQVNELYDSSLRTRENRQVTELSDVLEAPQTLVKYTHTVANDSSKYQNTLSSCLTEGSVADRAQSLLDWTYFYAVGVLKNYLRRCPQSWREVSARSRNAGNLLTPHRQNSLRIAGSNPSVLEFFTEQMVLSWTWERGCPVRICGAAQLHLFRRPDHKLSVSQNSSFIYLPLSISGQSTPLWCHSTGK